MASEVMNCEAHQKLMTACKSGDLKLAKKALRNDVNALLVNRVDQSGFAPLFVACENGHWKCVQLLIEKKADPTASLMGFTPLMMSCQYGFTQCVNVLLLEEQVIRTINAMTEPGTTAVSTTCARGSAPILYLLLEHAKADIGKWCASDALLHSRLPNDMNENSFQRSLAGFVLMCSGYDRTRAQLATGRLLEDYLHTHALLEERHAELLAVLDTDVIVDRRLHRKENGLYHEPLEQLLAYSGMLLKPQILNVHEDEKKGRVMLTGSFEAIQMAFDRHFARECGTCHKTSATHMKLCICHAARYCSVKCQQEDWPQHKLEHNKIMNALREEKKN